MPRPNRTYPIFQEIKNPDRLCANCLLYSPPVKRPATNRFKFDEKDKFTYWCDECTARVKGIFQAINSKTDQLVERLQKQALGDN